MSKEVQPSGELPAEDARLIAVGLVLRGLIVETTRDFKAERARNFRAGIRAEAIGAAEHMRVRHPALQQAMDTLLSMALIPG